MCIYEPLHGEMPTERSVKMVVNNARLMYRIFQSQKMRMMSIEKNIKGVKFEMKCCCECELKDCSKCENITGEISTNPKHMSDREQYEYDIAMYEHAGNMLAAMELRTEGLESYVIRRGVLRTGITPKNREGKTVKWE